MAVNLLGRPRQLDRPRCYGLTVPPDHIPFTYFIVGAQKAGTSTLWQTLNRHPHVATAPTKEMHYFTRDDVDWSRPSHDDYACPRRKPEQHVAGEATPAYLWWPRALERLHGYNPDARLVATLRDPVERLFSHWVMLRSMRSAALDWPTLLERSWSKDLPSELPDRPRHVLKGSYSAISRGFYSAQLERGFDVFDREQWLVLEFRSMLADMPATLDRLTDHVGVRRFHRPPEPRHAKRGVDVVTGTRPTGEDVVRLAELYAPDLARLPALTGLDVGHWPTVRVLAGDLDPDELATSLVAKLDWRESRPA